MPNAFYPPGQPNSSHQMTPFDADRRRQEVNTYLEPQQHGRSGTEGPASASLYYSQDAPAEGDMTEIGTGTDGFGAGANDSFAMQQQRIPYHSEVDYRHGYTQQRTGDSSYYRSATLQQSAENLQPSYQTPLYRETLSPADSLAPSDPQQHQQYYPDQYPTHQQYPPRSSMSASPQPLFRGEHDMNRPDTPGFYPDRAPKMEKLNTSQRKVVEQFPVDLDENDGSLWKSSVAMVKDWRSWVKWRYIPYYILIIVLVLLVAFMTIYHRQIIDWLTPLSQKVRSVTWGWVIPVIILFIISFPPLFGHEIVGVLLGVVYGLWIGFGILSLGTLLGEWGNFYAFKYLLKKHAERYERKSLNYACMAYIVREGGFLVVLLARLSAIPGHFTTAVFATVGMGFFVFTLATLLSMPKQLLVVYLGVVIAQSGNGAEPTSSKIVKYAVLAVSTLVTIFVAIYLYGRMHKARPIVQGQLRDRRYQMLTDAAGGEEVLRPTGISDESLGDADDSSAKLYGQSRSDLYSNEDLESSSAALTDEKKTSRWKKWGKKNKLSLTPSTETLQITEQPTTRGQMSQQRFDAPHQDGFYHVQHTAPVMQQRGNHLQAPDHWQQQQIYQQQQAQSHHQLEYQQHVTNHDVDQYRPSATFDGRTGRELR